MTESAVPAYAITAPDGKRISIPQSYDQATDLYTRLGHTDEAAAYFRENGYVVLRNVIPASLCDQARESFNQEVKPYPGYIYRQASASPEKHVWTANGYMLNAVMNIQDLPDRHFQQFKTKSKQVLTHAALKPVLRNLLQDNAILTQTMYFEGNPVTWPHQDTHYLDAQELGNMLGAWTALEDIQPGAGRFYIYPKSHTLQLPDKNSHITLNKQRYQQQILKLIQKHQLNCTAPALKKGDVLLWHSHTIHGSLPTTQPEFSRSSFTAHYIPANSGLLQFQNIQKRLRLKYINGMQVHHPKDQNRFANKLIFKLETSFPKPFSAAKKMAIRLFT